jgi:hypothetical protein
MVAGVVTEPDNYLGRNRSFLYLIWFIAGEKPATTHQVFGVGLFSTRR